MNESFQVEGTAGAIIGGLCLVFGHLLNYASGQPVGTTGGKLLVFAGHVVLVFAFVGVYSHQRTRERTPVGRAGMILSTIGTVLVSAIVFVELAGTTGVDTTPVFVAAGTSLLYSVGPLVFVLGMLTVGASVLRGDDLPRGGGGLLIVGTAVFAGASVFTDLAALLTVAGAVLTAAGFVWLGVAVYAGSSGQSGAGRLEANG